METTLCLLKKENAILLAMKKRGFGAGKYNGVGGKIEKVKSSTNQRFNYTDILT